MAPRKKAEPKPTSESAIIADMTMSLIRKATGEDPLTPSYDTLPHVSTGSLIVDFLIGGSKTETGTPLCPGFPRKRIWEVYGPESSGKTTLTLAAIAACQQAGGVAMFLDWEHALHHAYAKQVGVSFDPSKLLYYAPQSMEEGFKMAVIGMRAGIDLVVADSVAAMVPLAEMQKKLDDPAKVGARASKLSEVLPKMVHWLSEPPKNYPDHPGTAIVFINQERAKINTGGGAKGPQSDSAGGKALKFYAYGRTRLVRVRSEKVERIDPVTKKKVSLPFGNVVEAKIVKTKVDANQGQGGHIFIRYGYGVDNYLSVIEAASAHKVIQAGGGGNYTIGEVKVRGREQLRKLLMEDPALFKQVQSDLEAAILATAPQPITDLSETDQILSEVGVFDDDQMMEQCGVEDMEEEVDNPEGDD